MIYLYSIYSSKLLRWFSLDHSGVRLQADCNPSSCMALSLNTLLGLSNESEALGQIEAL